MFRGVSGHTGGQGEDNNDADSSDDESIMSRENENNTSNIYWIFDHKQLEKHQFYTYTQTENYH